MIERVGVLDHGHLELVAHCATDLDVVNAARVSFNATSDIMTDRDEGLVKFLMRGHHGTPFEHGFFKFRVKAPIFVFREWHRHRVGHSYNEWSARYSKLEPEFYTPEHILEQTGKPGAYKFEPVSEEDNKEYRDYIQSSYRESFATYEWLLNKGVSKQHARLVLPVATYSEMIWSCNPRSLMHFLALRNADQAQYEIREYAKATESFLEFLMPVTHKAFIELGRVAP
jgi:thymidylate synthase (FAD)